MPGSHFRLSASSAHRWIACPGSPREIDRVTDNGKKSEDTNFYAAEGTAAHALASKCLESGEDAVFFLDTKFGDFTVDDDMARHVQTYIDAVRNELEDGDTLFVEKHFTLAALDPPEPMGGTADAIIYRPRAKLMKVFDLKYGAGVVVEATENDQERTYAIGAALFLHEHRYKVSHVEGIIVQPRAPHKEGPIRRESYTAFELIEWTGSLMDHAKATQDPAAPLVAGAHCRFCPAAAVCPALRDRALAEAQMGFDANIETLIDNRADPRDLTVEQIGRLLDAGTMVETWLNSLRAHAFAMISEGKEIPNWKLVAKRGRRKWTVENEDELLVEIASVTGLPISDLTVKKLKSPAQVDKMLKKPQRALIADFYDMQSSGATLAPIADARDPVDLGDVSGFEFIQEET
jgi:hypothetical protein